MDKALEEEVRRRAYHRCEDCRIPEPASTLKHVIDHVIARQHGGATATGNLALSCGRCNLHKGPNVAGIDPATGLLTRLFNPRTDDWNQHFAWNGPLLIGQSDIGRTTIMVLAINNPARLRARSALLAVGEM